MAKFYVYVDEKVSVWQRNKVLVEAETEKEAQAKVIDEVKTTCGINNMDLINCDYLSDSENLLEPSQNNGIATLEVLDENFLTIWANGKRY
jgi:hypothetical protein